ncbi:MAG: polyamine aminopropyltransferase [Euryarchaeota archaeon]|nr:polyamine aminopropyltransferase [Euryarchaeota archaeon]
MELWFDELHTPNMRLGFRIKRELEHVRSEYQDIHVFETYDYGNLLVIDGTVQTTERDEFIYHEMIVHMPMLTHSSPERVLIVGGGDGGAAREALKHEPEEVHVVEIDEKVVEISKKYLPGIASAYEDSRVHLHVEDGIKFVKRSSKFDVIIVDSTDPVGPAEGLFHEDFYRDIKSAMNPGGVMAQQCGTPVYHPEELRNAYLALSRVFRYVRVFLAYIPTYPSGMWAFVMASDSEIKRRRNADFPTRYYSDRLYSSAMVLPEFVEKYCKDECKSD